MREQKYQKNLLTTLGLPTITQNVSFLGFCTTLAECLSKISSISFFDSSSSPFITQNSFSSNNRVKRVIPKHRLPKNRSSIFC